MAKFQRRRHATSSSAPATCVSSCSCRAALIFLGVIGIFLPVGCAQARETTTGGSAPLDCRAQLESLVGAGRARLDLIDRATPAAACSVQLCTDSTHAACVSASPPKSPLQLVFSDEFSRNNKSFAAEARDPKWTAEHMYYAGTYDEEVYLPEQVSTRGGAAIIRIERTGAANVSAPSQQSDGRVWNVSKGYKSGFLSSWNKFCYTGGYLEIAVQLPGDDFASGLWPAAWLMGNLARAGYMSTTAGMWPYTYNTCGGGDVATWRSDGPTPQNITACPDPPGFNRTRWGLRPGQGRGAPEIDLLEVKVDSSIGHKRGEAQGGAPGQQHQPFNSMTLQTAPLLPNGTTWTLTTGGVTTPGPGMYLPKTTSPEMYTHLTWWQGAFGSSLLDRPGNLYEDSVSAYAVLDPSFWTSMHKFGLLWEPGEYIRWFVDGQLVYEVQTEALRAQTNSSGTWTGPRLIPKEPMHILLNLALSDSFSVVDWQQLGFPAEYKIDYVRVYQRANANAYNVGCSPPDFPTAQYIACNRDRFALTQEEQVLIPDACVEAKTCQQEWGTDYVGGDLKAPDGNNVSFIVEKVKQCCTACQDLPECGAYTFVPAPINRCYLKQSRGWRKVRADGVLSGVVLDEGSLTPRDTARAAVTDGSGGASTTARSLIAAHRSSMAEVSAGWQRAPATGSPLLVLAATALALAVLS